MMDYEIKFICFGIFPMHRWDKITFIVSYWNEEYLSIWRHSILFRNGTKILCILSVIFLNKIWWSLNSPQCCIKIMISYFVFRLFCYCLSCSFYFKKQNFPKLRKFIARAKPSFIQIYPYCVLLTLIMYLKISNWNSIIEIKPRSELGTQK